jgi:hypothetical protein
MKNLIFRSFVSACLLFGLVGFISEFLNQKFRFNYDTLFLLCLTAASIYLLVELWVQYFTRREKQNDNKNQGNERAS